MHSSFLLCLLLVGYAWAAFGSTAAKAQPVRLSAPKANLGVCSPNQGVDYPGNNMPDSPFKGRKSADNCCALCARTEGCVAYVYYPPLDDCYLKNAVGNAILSVLVYSQYFREEVPSYWCSPQYGMDTTGVAMLIGGTLFNIKSPADCCDQCSNNTGCKEWVWDRSTSICYLKNRYGSLYYHAVTVAGYSKRKV